jgi:nitrate reductase NapD
MNISGVVVRTRPEKIDATRANLEVLPGVEVHGMHPAGRLVVTVEAASDRSLAERVMQLQEVPGVLSASMIYHQFEDNASDSQEIRQ